MKRMRRVWCICLVAFVACGAVFLLLDAIYPLIRTIYKGFGPNQPTFQSRTMSQWLQVLRTSTNAPEAPLKILRIINEEDQPRMCAVEVPVSYELVRQHGFCQGRGKFDLVVNGRHLSTTCWPATNGNCLLPFDRSDLAPGTNRIQVVFMIFNPSDTDRFLRATGPVEELVSGRVDGVSP